MTGKVPARLIEVCTVAFNQKGYRKVSMDSVARELRISKKTIYKHFSSKEEILETVLRTRLGRYEERLTKVLKKSKGIDSLREIAKSYHAYLLGFSPLLMDDIKLLTPHLFEWGQVFERDVFKKSFSRAAKDLRKKNVINYPQSTKELTTFLFKTVESLRDEKWEKVEAYINLTLAGMEAHPKRKG